MPQRAIRFSETTLQQIQQAAKQKGFASITAMTRHAVDQCDLSRNVGRQVVSQLLATDVRVRPMARSPESADAAAVAPALERIAKHARRIVFLSNLTARDGIRRAANPVTTLHAKIERLIEVSDVR
jgi:hypothetical protein